MRNIILWNHERGTWQYDVFCLLIIAFIFLTPKPWFAGSKKKATPRMLSSVQVGDFSASEKKLESQNTKLSDSKNTDISKKRFQ